MPIARRLPPLTDIGARESIEIGRVDGPTGEMAGGQAGTAGFSEEVLVHEPQLRARARKLCKTDEDAEDVVQETLLRAWKHYSRLEPSSNIRGWLFKILTRVCIDGVRHAGVVKQVPFGPEHDVGVDPPSPPAHASIGWEDVEAVLPQLPPHLRHVIDLRAQQLQYDEIGQRLGIPTNTVGTRIRRACEDLRRLLGIGKKEDDE